MSDNIDKLRDDRVAQHSSVQRERVKPHCAIVGVISFVVKVLSFGVHVSPTPSSQRHESAVVAPDAPEV